MIRSNPKTLPLVLLTLILTLVTVLTTTATVNAQVPPGYMSCALEGDRCMFTGATKEVLYGIGDKFVRKTAKDFILCSLATFGSDPAPNVHKKCYIPYDRKTDSPGSGHYKFCAVEGERCKFSEQHKVIYGDGDNWAIVVASNGIDCNVSQFGDPAPNVRKKCYFSTDCCGSASHTFNDNLANPLTLKRIDYSGAWISVDAKGAPIARDSVVTITQQDDVLTDNTKQTMRLTAGGIVEFGRARGATGSISQNGTKITWSDGRIWIKQAAAAPREFPDTLTNPNVYKPAQTVQTGVFPGFSADEMRCVNLTQDHVAFDYDANSTPQTHWTDQDLYTLCRETVIPLRTVECYLDARNNMGAGDKPAIPHAAALSKCFHTAFTPPKAKVGEDQDIVNVTPKAQTSEEANILLKDSKPVSQNDMKTVLRWIASETTAVRLPFCWRRSTKRGAPLARASNAICPKGYEVSIVGCSPPCPADFNGYKDAGTCYQTCKGNRPVDCSLFGCTRDNDTCSGALKDQFTSIGTLAFNIVSEAVSKAGGIAGNVEKYKKLHAAAEHLRGLVEKYQLASGVVGAITAEIDLYQTMVAANFAVVTSPEIEATIDKKFGRIGGFYVKKQYALVQLGLTGDANFMGTWKNVASLVGVADPTGLIDVWNAFFQPLCDKTFPFPNVGILYRL